MGFEITQGAAFYIIMMLIVIVIGIGIVTGFKMPSKEKLESLSRTFQPGSIYITNDKADIPRIVQLDCSQEVYRLYLNQIKLASRKVPDDSNKVLQFLILLDYDNRIFEAQYGSGDAPKTVIDCESSDDLYVCPQELVLRFALSGVGKPTGTRILHFTAWKYTPALENAITPTVTLGKLLDDYSESYMSSFDLQFNTEQKCQEHDCASITDETACHSKNGCFWDSAIIVDSTCKICPDYTECTEYDKEQCTQCPIPVANCQPGTLWGCEVKE